MKDASEATYDPMKPVTHWREIGGAVILDIERRPEEIGKN